MSRWWWPRPQHDEHRWVVLDVESSGLDARRDRLLAVAAIALHSDGDRPPRIVLSDSFELVLQQHAPVHDKANILLHGIGVGAQRQGRPAAEGLAELQAWVGRSPLIAFHAAFDRTLLDRAMHQALGRRLVGPWLDLEDVAAVLRPDLPARSLDEWMAALGVHCLQRHQAAADTLATAELLLKLWPAVQRAGGRPGFAGLQQLARQRRWLPRATAAAGM